MQDYGAAGRTWIHCVLPAGSVAVFNTYADPSHPGSAQLLCDDEQTARDASRPWVPRGRQDATLGGPVPCTVLAAG